MMKYTILKREDGDYLVRLDDSRVGMAHRMLEQLIAGNGLGTGVGG
jgi:hypothetical protein